MCVIFCCVTTLMNAEPAFNYQPWTILVHYYNYELNKKHQMKNTTQKC